MTIIIANVIAVIAIKMEFLIIIILLCNYKYQTFLSVLQVIQSFVTLMNEERRFLEFVKKVIRLVLETSTYAIKIVI